MRLHRNPTLAVLAAAAVGVVAPVAMSSAAKPAGKTVTLKNISFNPAKTTVKKGATVTWVWKDGATPHNVTSTGKTKFKSSATKQSGTYAVRFAKAGTYHYECTIHPGMTGSVVVK